MRTIKTWLATIAVLLCCVTMSAHDFEVNGIYYKVTSETDLTVGVAYKGYSSGSYSNEYSGTVTIPPTVTFQSEIYDVTSIEGKAFSGCSELTVITIPESVSWIGERAFEGCNSLISVVIPTGVTSIEDYTFLGCSGLTSIYIPEGVEDIKNCAFQDCSSLTSITIPKSMSMILGNPFTRCI